jgi:4-diphosphocytidyl-2-C-methyl-D-erythritol kinase
MSRAARVAAQAKINLVLHVLAREESGFHGIETVFARLSLADVVTVRATSGGRSIECPGIDVGPAESNLAYRAAATYAEVAGWPSGFAIEIEKRIPVGGGLGGGSADAGAVLRVLNALATRPLPPERLLALAATLGSDVPFLTLEYPFALAWGRGERMLAMRPLPAAEVELVCFPFGVSTASAYDWLAATRSVGPPHGPRSLEPESLESWASIASLAANDFEGVVAAHHPTIAGALRLARDRGAAIAQLSGSGSTVFVIPRLPGEGLPTPAAGGSRVAAEASPDMWPVMSSLPEGARVLRARTATSVEDVVPIP